MSPSSFNLSEWAINNRALVSFNLNTDVVGGDVATMEGEARIDPAFASADRNPAYVAKYREGMTRIGMTPESFARAYSVAVRITPARLRGH